MSQGANKAKQAEQRKPIKSMNKGARASQGVKGTNQALK
jgi:hypothetical protein